MQTLRQDIAYALRQMRLSPVFTLTAMLTLALGIGATTAIFSLIDTVMLKSLPVVDPASLYRIGDGQDCCVEGSPQDNWGILLLSPSTSACSRTPLSSRRSPPSRPAAVQISVRRGETRSHRQTAARRNRQRQLLLHLRPRRIRRPHHRALRRSALLAARRHAQLSHLAAAVRLRSQRRRFHLHRRATIPFTIIGITPPGFFGETLRSDPPDLWLPINQEPVLSPDPTPCCITSRHGCASSAVYARRHRRTPLARRMTALIRQWLVNDSGMPADWMSGIKADLPKQNIRVVPAGIGVGDMKADYGDQPAHPARRLLPRPAHRLRQHRQSAAGSRSLAPHADLDPPRARRIAQTPHPPVAHRKHRPFCPRRPRRTRCRVSRRQSSSSPSPSTARTSFPSTPRRPCPCSPSPSRCRSSPAPLRHRARHGSPRTPIRSRLCAAPIAAPATTPPARRRPWSSCRPRSPSSCSPAPACSPAAS